jgi:hypothetical protein
MNLTLGSGVTVGGCPKGAGHQARALPFLSGAKRARGTKRSKSVPGIPIGRSGMRSALLLSVVSAALLGILGWVRHESHRNAAPKVEAISSDDDFALFVG